MHEGAGADLEALSDLCTPWCIHVVTTLRIADHIAAGVSDIDALATVAECDSYALHQVLAHLVAKGVFLQPADGQFALTETARGLLDPPVRLGLDLDGIGGRFAHAWGTLLGYVRTGAPAYRERFGLGFWEDLDAHPGIAASFDDLIGPAGHGDFDPEFPLIGGWDSVHRVVDVGGGTGAMLAAMLHARPEIRGTLVDLPRTATRSGEIFEAAGVTGRVTIVGQSFFDPLPPGADLYLLRGVLNDWPDRDATTILRRCAEAAGSTGRVVILKGIRPDDAPVGISIETVLLGGKLRTVTELRELAACAGLEVSAVDRQLSGHVVVECRPS